MNMSQWADLKSWRKKLGLSQQKLAQMARISLGTLRQIEEGSTKPHSKTLDKLSISVKELTKKFQGTEKLGKATTPAKRTAKGRPKRSAAEKSITNHQVESGPILLTNLDLELINRILRMSGQEKLTLLQKLMQ